MSTPVTETLLDMMMAESGDAGTDEAHRDIELQSSDVCDRSVRSAPPMRS